jgi:hypothetical protein
MRGGCQVGSIDAEFAGAGARPLSMGGAFLGLADDSTAAEFNPAGIRILRRPEIAWQVTHTFDVRDEYFPVREVREEDHNEWTTPSFISYVHPGQKLTWALSQLTNIDFVHEYKDQDEFVQMDTRTAATNNAFGLTFATDIKPRLHVGVTLRMDRFHFEFDQKTRVDDLAFRRSMTLTDWSPSANLGILWRATKNWSFGSVYKSPQAVAGKNFETQLPQTIGIGTAYHPNDKVRVLADVDYITWADFDPNPHDDYIRNDVIRMHLGGEYLIKLLEDYAIFVRGGVMRENSNAFYYDGPIASLQRANPEEPDKNHVSVGLGLAAEGFQIDLAVDHVLTGSTILILSMIHYF